MRSGYLSVAAVVVGSVVWVGGTAVRGEPEAGAGKIIQVEEAALRAAIGEETQRVMGVMERRLRKVEVELADAREAVRLLAADHARLVRGLQGGRAGAAGGGGAAAERPVVEADQRLAALGGQLATLRAQISVYAQQHGGKPPTLAQLQANWGVLTSTTDAEGNIGRGDFGPYINTVPRNALTGKSGVVGGGGGKIGSDVGWAYDEETGGIYAVVPKGTPVNAKDVVFAK